MNLHWRSLNWQFRKIQRRFISLICSKLYRDNKRDIGDSTLVAGTARSGTTWVANIISSQISCRIMFEPFHSKKVEEFALFNYFQYMRPTENNSELKAYCQKIFSGDIRHKWIDRHIETIFPRYRLIKEIRANLFLKWIKTNFPEIPIFLIIRHPCAVVLSRIKLSWATDTDIRPFLVQDKLVTDFLADKIDLIKHAKSVEEKHSIIWCISNLIPIKQFNGRDLNVIFYENLCLQPDVEIPKIFKILQYDYKNSVFDYANRPSTTSIRNSAIVTGENKVTRWKKELTSEQISSIMSIVEAFGLHYIYGDSFHPLVSTL